MANNMIDLHEVVDMEDQVIIPSVANAKAPKKAEVVQVGNVLSWTFQGGKVATIDLDKLSPEMMKAAALHGLKQTISDAYSGEKNSGTAYALAQVRIDTLIGGSWTNRSAGGSGAVQSDLIQALMVVTGKAVEEVTAVVVAMDADKVKLVKKDARVAAAIARIQADRLAKAAGAAGADLDALFGGAI